MSLERKEQNGGFLLSALLWLCKEKAGYFYFYPHLCFKDNWPLIPICVSAASVKEELSCATSKHRYLVLNVRYTSVWKERSWDNVERGMYWRQRQSPVISVSVSSGLQLETRLVNGNPKRFATSNLSTPVIHSHISCL